MGDANTASAAFYRPRNIADIGVTVGLAVVMVFFIVNGFLAYSNIQALIDNNRKVTYTHDVITGLDNLISLLKDAETGQRGYVLTGVDRYLEPYDAAISALNEQVAIVDRLVADRPEEAERMTQVKARIGNKLEELQQTINLRRSRGLNAALAVIESDRGRNEMDAIRLQVNLMKSQEEQMRADRMADMQVAYRTALVTGYLTSALGFLLSLTVGWLMRRASAARRRQEWLQGGQVGLGAAMFGDQRVEQLGDNILKFMARYFDAHAGAFFVKRGDSFVRVATYGVPDNAPVPDKFKTGDALLGQAAAEERIISVHDVPDGYLTLGSALGRGSPRHLLIAPAAADGSVNAVLELGFVHHMRPIVLELMQKASEQVSIAVRSAHYRSNLQDLLEETQRQAEELQAQGEELRVSNEELEEQSRSLKESQTRLEEQQAELEQTNTQLEEQARELEQQRDDLEDAKQVVQVKARELERASQYKSDFLANMSHELRTPLNSSLILAKLLADNVQGNLTDEQVKFAQTIQSSGNDLLALINDILDLSKIEAGHMEIHPETLSLARLLKDMERVFDPLARQKGIVFRTSLRGSCPETIHSDRQRLEQVLKNLLSNAVKFTERGEVALEAFCEDGKVSFAVMDTGIGISAEHQQSIFDAFRQADGTISRKYGGTGLGLSISRELSRLLGGSIHLDSTPGQGSTFTLELPQVYDPADVAARPEPQAGGGADADGERPAPVPATAKMSSPKYIRDDREKLRGDKRVILVIEDDANFATILTDLAHELNFQCIVASTAEEAFILARQYLPSAVVLDVGLPDHSGLTVLDRMKQDPRTRHIPVHVVSAADCTQKAFSLGAVGYMLKPVKREDLSDALKNLETRLEHRMRRVLVVEDDPVQLDSVRQLLASAEVDVTGASTAAECLSLLKQENFDCMVLDLSLPDASGYSLLETLSAAAEYSFPPVIVYTGRELSADEEQRLRRYSKSIIIKGAKSPERLLDEVTLFLHQVVSDLPQEQQKMLERVKSRDAALEKRNILVVEDDIRNVYALGNILEPRGAIVHIARNGIEALARLEQGLDDPNKAIDLVLMDVMMPEMDGMTATREIRKRPEWKKLPVIMLTAKAMRDDQEKCLEAGASDYMAKPLDVEKLLSLIRVWMPR